MATPSSPISSRIGQVFIPVRDVAIAADWYARLLGVEPGDIAHHGTICDIPTEGEVRLALDGNRPDFATDGPPRFFWWADDLDDVRRHLESIHASDIGEITDIGSVAFLQFRDPDGTPLMVCSQPSR